MFWNMYGMMMCSSKTNKLIAVTITANIFHTLFTSYESPKTPLLNIPALYPAHNQEIPDFLLRKTLLFTTPNPSCRLPLAKEPNTI